jgi:type IV pilus assembly protein PilM
VFGLGKSKAVVGLDIGSSAVKAVELKAVGKGFKVVAFAIEPVPPDSIVDGAIIDGAAVADAIRRVFENKAFKTKEVAASLSGNAVIVKKINLPVMTEAELAESIYWEAEQYIPFDIQDVNLDYQILDAGTGPESKGTMDVLLVAAKKEKIADYTGVISQAGRVPIIVDVDAFALQNAYEVNYGLEPDAVVVLLNAGASAININILTGDQSTFTRDISIGGNSYTEAVQKELNLPFESAEQLKRGHAVEGVNPDDVTPVLHAMTENVLLEIQKTFDFFKATAASDRIDRIVLSGGASRVDGFEAALQERFNTPIEVFDPVQENFVRSGQAGRHRSGRSESNRRGGRRPRAPSAGRPMIRINLLAVERDRGKKKAVTLGTTGQKLTIGCSLILVLSVLFIGWRYWALGRESAQLDADISAAQQETTRLHSVIQQVQQFEQRKAQLQQRVALIEQLRKGQTGPVHMLDQISRALPPMLWLTELKQTGADVVIDGRATSITGLSEFVSNLEASGYFKRSIEIVSTTTESPAGQAGELIKFTIKGIFQQPDEAKPAAPNAKQSGG